LLKISIESNSLNILFNHKKPSRKNMKKLLLITIALCILFNSDAQDFKPNWGPKIESRTNITTGYKYKLVGIEGDYYYSLLIDKKSSTLFQYDMDHKKVSEKSLDFSYQKGKLTFDETIETQNGKFGIFDYLDKNKKKWSMFSSKFENETFEEYNEFYNHPFKAKYGLLKFALGMSSDQNEDAKKQIQVSRNKSKVLITNILNNTDDGSKEEQAIAVFDADLNLLWDKIHVFNHKDHNIQVIQSIVTNTGEVYLLSKIWDKQSKKRTWKLPNYDLFVFKMTENETKEFRLSLDEVDVAMDAKLFFPDEIGEGNDFVLGGFYKDKSTRSSARGLFMAFGNDEKGFNAIKKHPLKNIVSSNYKIDRLFHFNDDNFGLIAEIRWSKKDDNDVSFHSNSIMIPRFTKEGDLIDAEIINKNYMSTEFHRTSYSFAEYKNKMYFVFNDLKNAKEKKKIKSKRGLFNIYTDLVVLNLDNGEIEFNETIFTKKETEIEFIPNLHSYGKGKLLIIGKTKLSFINYGYTYGLINLN